MSNIELKLSGLTCNGCIKATTNVLQTLPGIKKADVQLDKAIITFDGEPTDQQVDKIITAIKDIGYQAEKA